MNLKQDTRDIEVNQRPPKVFLGGPFSSALKRNDLGQLVFYDSPLRKHIEDAIKAILSTDALLLNSHLADGWGEIDFGTGFSQRDLAWIHECDVYVALLPEVDGVPYRTDGTFLEIGHALAAGKDVVFLLGSEIGEKWSFFIRDLINCGLVRCHSLHYFLCHTEEVIFNGLFADSGLGSRRQVTDVKLWNWFQHHSKLPLSVTVGEANLIVLPGVMNPRFSHSPDFMMDFWKIPNGSKVLDMGCGCGVLGINALLAGAGELVAVDLNPMAVENTKVNLRLNNLTERGKVVESDGFSNVNGLFDVILFNPPYWGDIQATVVMERASFDTPGHGFLRKILSELKRFLTINGRCFVAFSDQGDVALLVREVQSNGLWIENLVLQRPTKPGFHIRVGLELGLTSVKGSQSNSKVVDSIPLHS